jgi:uncharacterized protein YjbJ (UPF0337 family)
MAKARTGNKKMNEKQMERKIQQDSVKVKKGLNSMMEDSVSLVSKGLERLTGEAKVWWGKLTDDDLDKVEGNYDKLIGLLQEKYGYTRAQAEEEWEKRTK